MSVFSMANIESSEVSTKLNLRPALKIRKTRFFGVTAIVVTMVRVERIELSAQPWEGHVLPLHHTRFQMTNAE